MTLQLVTFIYDIFLYAKCYVIHIVLDRIKSNQINILFVYGYGDCICPLPCLSLFIPGLFVEFLVIAHFFPCVKSASSIRKIEYIPVGTNIT